MKRIICLAVSICMITILTGCSGRPEDTALTEPEYEITQTTPIVTEKEESPVKLRPSQKETLPDTDPWNENAEIWGTPVTVSNQESGYTCNIPEDSIVRNYEDHTMIKTLDNQILGFALSDSAYSESHTIDDAFEGYLDTFEDYLTDFMLHIAEDYEMTVVEQEEIILNNKQTIKVRGTLTFTENGRNERNWVFLGYAVKLSTGNYAIWIASASNGFEYVNLKRVSENMANSFSEVLP